MNLKQFIAEAQYEVNLVKKQINWEGVCSFYELDKSKCSTFKTMSNNIRGLDLVAYGMTELLPSAEGDLNVKILDITLRNAGSNYVMAIPAMADIFLSFGLYQFTSYALYDSQGEVQGASIVNQFLPKKYQIPGSVIKLRNGENHRAAYLFALHNFALLCKKTNAKEFKSLQAVAKRKSHSSLVIFMATAHHAPKYAINFARIWLSEGGVRSLNNSISKKHRLKEYARKTIGNLTALEQYAARH